MEATKKVVGKQFLLVNGIMAKVYDHGTIILKAGDVEEFYDRDGKFNSATSDGKQLWIECGEPENMHEFVQQHGRPYGVIWQ
jgi:hypothetical protein